LVQNLPPWCWVNGFRWFWQVFWSKQGKMVKPHGGLLGYKNSANPFVSAVFFRPSLLPPPPLGVLFLAGGPSNSVLVLDVSHPTPTACRPRTWNWNSLTGNRKSEVSESGGKWLTAWRWQARALPWLVILGRLRPYHLWAGPLDAGQQNALRLMSGLSERLSVLGKTSLAFSAK
jgi:hypothetical protein